jgi:hypothetical protein
VRRATERARELVGARIARARVLGRRPRDHLLERHHHVGIDAIAPCPRRLLERHAEREHLGAHGERRALKELRRGVLRRQALGPHAALAPRGREPQVHERGAAVVPDDDVGGLDVAVEQERAMQQRELVGGLRDGREVDLGIASLRDKVCEARALDELADHVRALAVWQPPEAQHARDPEPLDAGERRSLADEGEHLTLIGPFAERLERHRAPRYPIAHGPDLTAASLAERRDWLVARREEERFPQRPTS